MANKKLKVFSSLAKTQNFPREFQSSGGPSHEKLFGRRQLVDEIQANAPAKLNGMDER